MIAPPTPDQEERGERAAKEQRTADTGARLQELLDQIRQNDEQARYDCCPAGGLTARR
jgi:hypothetical protein